MPPIGQNPSGSPRGSQHLRSSTYPALLNKTHQKGTLGWQNIAFTIGIVSPCTTAGMTSPASATIDIGEALGRAEIIDGQAVVQPELPGVVCSLTSFPKTPRTRINRK
jgi:hypothetical protein